MGMGIRTGMGIGDGSVVAPGRGGPVQDTRLGLLEVPAFGLFAAMMVAA